MKRPGWWARARARGGVRHPRGRVALGYQSGLMGTVTLSKKELGHHGSVFGATGSGKTTLLNVIIQGHAPIGPTIIIDAKGSLAMQRAVAAAGGLVWTIGGRLKLNLLDADPTVLAEQLTVPDMWEGPSQVYAQAAERALQWVGNILRWEGLPPTLEAVEDLLRPGALTTAFKKWIRQPRVQIWQAELEKASSTEIDGMATALMRVTRLIDSAAGSSLGIDLDAARLEDVVQGKTTLLISLDSRRYPSLARILGGWSLVALQRACAAVPADSSCLYIVDEVSALGRQARHLSPLLDRARDARVGVVVAAHGPTQLDSAYKGLANEVLQQTAWTVVMAQGDPDDADQLSRLFPLKEPSKDNRVTLGKFASGEPSVTRDDLMWLRTGDCWFRVRPVDGLWGQWGHARIAVPDLVELPQFRAPQTTEESTEVPPVELAEGVQAVTEVSEEKRLVYAKVRTIEGWRFWRGNFDKDGYPRIWIPGRGRYVAAHKLIYVWEQGPVARGQEIDHECGLKDCLDHMKGKSKPANIANREARKRGEIPTGHEQYAVKTEDA